jgi:hypothetical protein
MGSTSSSSYYSNDYINESMNSISSYVNNSESSVDDDVNRDSYISNKNKNITYSETLSSEEVDNDCINVLLESGLSHYIKDKCCLRRNQTYDLFATIGKNRSYYNYYMKACCYANLTGDINYLNCVKEKGLFPFNIGMLDIVKLNSNKEVYDFKKNSFRVFKINYKKENITNIWDENIVGVEVEVKFNKIPYIGVIVD